MLQFRHLRQEYLVVINRVAIAVRGGRGGRYFRKAELE
jgi:hypothetical protein